jgi:hypothetical protein
VLYFLSGLPRSGSTVLAAILNQHPQVYASPTSGLVDLLGAIVGIWEQNPAMAVQGQSRDELLRLMRGTIHSKYEHITKSIIIDKSRGWPNPTIMKTMAEVLGQSPKIIATVRNVPDCAASFVRAAKPENTKDFLRQSQVIQHLRSSYVNLQKGFQAEPKNFLFVEYENLLNCKQEQMDLIHEFLGLAQFKYDFSNIQADVVAERDVEVWNIPGLHDVKPKLEKQHNQDSREVLGTQYEGFCQPAFWRGEVTAFKEKPLIDKQQEAGLRGDFELGWELSQKLMAERPDDDRAAFNAGWYYMMRGQLLDGMRLMDRGRAENVFGKPPVTNAPMWDGHTPGDILLTLEGGFGDQINQVRFAKDIALRGSRAIVVAAPEIIPLFKSVPGITALCTREAAPGVYHDFQVLGMSGCVPLGLEYKDITGEPYILLNKINRPEGRLRIGLRWQGSSDYDNELKRLFDPPLLFKAVEGIDADFVCLQRDEGAEHCPNWVKKVPLADWITTANIIRGCDLVISSCTSIGHLGGALGVPTWIMVPVMPYFLWAMPGDKACWYDSVRLFRQEKYEDWTSAFDKVKKELWNLADARQGNSLKNTTLMVA